MKGQKGYAIVSVPAHASAGLFSALRAVYARLLRWQQLSSQRRRLSALSDAALKDIGLSRADIMQETQRPFWDDPLSK